MNTRILNTYLSLFILLFINIHSSPVKASRYHCVASNFANFADDPDHIQDKKKALLAAQNFYVNTQTGIVTDQNSKRKQWQIIENNGLLGTSRLMNPNYYGKILIDDFLDIIHDDENKTQFKRTIIDGMVSGYCTNSPSE